MKTIRADEQIRSVASCVAPEDLECGDFVAILNVIREFPSFLWCCDSSTIPPDEVVQVTFRPNHAGEPLKVEAICLPFVMVRTGKQSCLTLDVRQTQLVRLNKKYARAVWKEFRVRSK